MGSFSLHWEGKDLLKSQFRKENSNFGLWRVYDKLMPPPPLRVIINLGAPKVPAARG